MKKFVFGLILTILLTGTASAAFAYTEPKIEWSQNSYEYGKPTAMFEYGDSIFTAGTSGSNGGYVERRLKSNGQYVWYQYYSSGTGYAPTDIVVDSTGVYITGISYNQYSSSVMKLSLTDGSEQWKFLTFGNSSTNQDKYDSLALSGDNLYVGGISQQGTGLTTNYNGTARVFKLNKTNGAFSADTNSSGLLGMGAVLHMKADSTGVYIIYGRDSVSGGGTVLKKLGPGLGSSLWSTLLSSTNNNAVGGLEIDSTGVYVVGYANRIVALQKFGLSGGASVWSNSWAGGGALLVKNSTLYDIAAGSYAGILTMDTSGSYLWSKQFSAFSLPPADFNSGFKAYTADDQGNIYIAESNWIIHKVSITGGSSDGFLDIGLRVKDNNGVQIIAAEPLSAWPASPVKIKKDSYIYGLPLVSITDPNALTSTRMMIGGVAKAFRKFGSSASNWNGVYANIYTNAVQVNSGSSVLLSWASQGATSGCTASGSWGPGPVATSGSQKIINVTKQMTFELTCTNPSGTAMVSTNVYVNGGAIPPPSECTYSKCL